VGSQGIRRHDFERGARVSVKGRQQPDRIRERISRGVSRWHARRRAALRVVPSDLVRLWRGDVSPAIAPFLAEAHAEAQALHAALGGRENMTAQRAVILDDVVRVGVILRAELARYLQTQDPDAAGRVGTLATVRRSSLAAVGLDERRVEHDLGTYLASAPSAQDGAGATIDAVPGPRAGAPDDRGPTRETKANEAEGPARKAEGGGDA
jgi:hypothetical protein